MSFQRIAFWLLAFDWPPIPSTFAATFGSLTSVGGVGLIGRGTLTFSTLFPQSAQVSTPVPTAKVLQGATVGVAYSETISVQGGTAPYSLAVTVGTLPDGMALALDSGDGEWKISGSNPTTVQTADFTIQATDVNGAAGSTDFEISVKAASSGASIHGWAA